MDYEERFDPNPNQLTALPYLDQVLPEKILLKIIETLIKVLAKK